MASIQNTFPNPLESAAGAKTLTAADGTAIPVAETGPVVAFVFKTLFDPFAGQLSMAPPARAVKPRNDPAGRSPSRNRSQRL